MQFNEIVQEALAPLLTANKFLLVEYRDNYLKYRSKKIELVMCYNKLEKSNMLFIGRANGHIWHLDGLAMIDLFGIKLKINFSSTEDFAKKLKLLFEDQGKSLMAGDLTIVNALEAYTEKTSTEYHAALITKHNQEETDIAWNKADYAEFIKHMDAIDVELWSPLDHLKYQMARKRVNQE